MANWTKSDVANAVLEFLGVKDGASSADSNDKNRVTKVYESCYAQLDKIGLTPFAIGEVPDWAQQPVVEYVSVKSGPFFGRLLPDGAKIMAERDLRTQVQGLPTKEPIEGEYF